MRKKLQYAVSALLLFFSTVYADSNDISVDVEHSPGNLYEFKLYFVADAPVEDVFAIFTDYNNLALLNPSIQSSRLLSSEQADITRVEIVSRNCILFFCKTLKRVEDVRTDENKSIDTHIVPSMSNFKSGETFWTFVQEGDKTIITMQASLVPDFWVPPFIGPRTIMKKIRQQLNHTVHTVDDLLAKQRNE